jgi:hypothetical protein
MPKQIPPENPVPLPKYVPQSLHRIVEGNWMGKEYLLIFEFVLTKQEFDWPESIETAYHDLTLRS